MFKFELKNRMFNIIKCCEAMLCYLNREIVIFLIILGVEDNGFEVLFLEYMYFFGSMLISRDVVLAVFESIGMGENNVLVKMLYYGYELNIEFYFLMMFRVYLDN